MKKTSILLVFPKTGPAFYTPPFGLLALATQLERAGYQVTILDCRQPAWKALLKRYLQQTQPLFVGITSMTGPQIFHGLAISQQIRQYGQIPIVWGGIHPSFLPEQTLRHPWIDIVVCGWADHSVVSLADALRDGTSLELVGQIGYKTPAGEIRLTDASHYRAPQEFTPYAWHLIEPQFYLVPDLCKGQTISLFTSRGCPHACTYCYGPAFHCRRWIAQSPAEVLDDVDRLRQRIHFDSIYFHDDNFCVDQKRVVAIAEGLKARQIAFGVSIRIDRLSESFAQMLADNGCVRVDWGADSGVDRILKLYRKNVTVADNLNGVRLSQKHGFIGQTGIVVGHPEETWDELNQSLDFLDEIRRINPHQRIGDVKILTPYPGSEYYDEARHHGFVPPASLEAWGSYYWNNALMPWLGEKKKILEVISFTSLIVFVHWRLKRKNPLYNAVLWLFHKLESVRWRRRYWKFAWEVRLMKRYMDLITFFMKAPQPWMTLWYGLFAMPRKDRRK